eukprot:SAG31_NODE_1995_length_6708_cov_49.258889_4_plen_148_part_00
MVREIESLANILVFTKKFAMERLVVHLNLGRAPFAAVLSVNQVALPTPNSLQTRQSCKMDAKRCGGSEKSVETHLAPEVVHSSFAVVERTGDRERNLVLVVGNDCRKERRVVNSSRKALIVQRIYGVTGQTFSWQRFRSHVSPATNT